ncbi:hypothetical protein C7S18_01060 [Ahniella affigens]|uniref:Uncharacterized protein n=1 Tax=Ahniella affigens TaxID=2021234 RepID=A0A2P1PLZ9_9GAMM|nr:hypothetical protein C7S18_01060 [Ahniella affigens]
MGTLPVWGASIELHRDTHQFTSIHSRKCRPEPEPARRDVSREVQNQAKTQAGRAHRAVMTKPGLANANADPNAMTE